jgi:hypothetical protein
MSTSTQTVRDSMERKMQFALEKRNGNTVRFNVPGHFTVGQAKDLLAERSGYEPNLAGDPASVRLAQKTEQGTQLIPDETAFRDLEEGTLLKPIPSLSPASAEFVF